MGCKCGSRAQPDACCEIYLRGNALPPTALTLMKSRYTAFTKCNERYLLDTWHPSTRPAKLDFRGDKTEWTKLEIVDVVGGTTESQHGVVEFKAFYRLGARSECLHERSSFIREEGRWLYLSGESPSARTPTNVGRNAPCPCGSGKKFKRCCG